jgi:hypothetical protein
MMPDNALVAEFRTAKRKDFTAPGFLSMLCFALQHMRRANRFLGDRA